MIPKMLVAILFSLVSIGASANTGMKETSYKIWGVAVYRTFYKDFVNTYTLPVMGGTVTATYTVRVVTVDYGTYGGLSEAGVTSIVYTYTGSTYPIVGIGHVSSYLSQYYYLTNDNYRIRDSANGYTIADFTSQINISIASSLVNPYISSSFTITAVTSVP